MKKPKKSGGQRENSGRKLIYGERTVQFQRSVPFSKKPIIEKMVDDYLKPLLINPKT